MFSQLQMVQHIQIYFRPISLQKKCFFFDIQLIHISRDTKGEEFHQKLTLAHRGVWGGSRGGSNLAHKIYEQPQTRMIDIKTYF